MAFAQHELLDVACDGALCEAITPLLRRALEEWKSLPLELRLLNGASALIARIESLVCDVVKRVAPPDAGLELELVEEGQESALSIKMVGSDGETRIRLRVLDAEPRRIFDAVERRLRAVVRERVIEHVVKRVSRELALDDFEIGHECFGNYCIVFVKLPLFDTADLELASFKLPRIEVGEVIEESSSRGARRMRISVRLGSPLHLASSARIETVVDPPLDDEEKRILRTLLSVAIEVARLLSERGGLLGDSMGMDFDSLLLAFTRERCEGEVARERGINVLRAARILRRSGGRIFLTLYARTRGRVLGYTVAEIDPREPSRGFETLEKLLA